MYISSTHFIDCADPVIFTFAAFKRLICWKSLHVVDGLLLHLRDQNNEDI